MTPEQIRRLADGLADTLSSIDADALDATPVEKAYLAGAHHALRTALDEAS